MEYGPIVRIILRYIVGAGLMGSAQAGEIMSQDPDLVFAVSLGVGFLVEAYYAAAKKYGKPT